MRPVRFSSMLFIRRMAAALVVAVSSTLVYAGPLEDMGAAWKRGDATSVVRMASEFVQTRHETAGNMARAFAFRGLAYSRLGEYDKAITDFSEAYIRSGWTWHDVVYERALAKEKKFDIDGALDDYSMLLRANPSDLGVMVNRATLLLDRGEFEKAIDQYAVAIRAKPNFDTAWFARGLAHFYAGNFALAEQDLLESSRIYPHVNTALWTYLSQKRAGKNADKALQESRVALEAKGWQSAIVALFLGRAGINDVTAAVSNSDPAIERDQVCGSKVFLAQYRILRREGVAARALLTEVLKDCEVKHRAGLASELQRVK